MKPYKDFTEGEMLQELCRICMLSQHGSNLWKVAWEAAQKIHERMKENDIR